MPLLSLSCCAYAVSRSVASGRRFSTTFSHSSSNSEGISLYTCSIDGLTMPMSIPSAIAWYRNTECIASRTLLLPRNENDRLLTPPLTFAYGQLALTSRRRG